MLKINNSNEYNRHTKYKPSVIYKKTKKPLFNFHVPLHLFHYAIL